MRNRCVYIVRLDDAAPTMNHERWAAVEQLLVKYDIKPIVAIVPNNIDPVLVRSNVDPNFWGRVRSWQSMGWHIAMHGYSHEALTTNKGLVPLHNKSEFAGVPESEQRQKIRRSLEIFRHNGLEPKIWVAPFHAFDRVTLRALSSETNIRVVSDGVAKLPFSEMGLFWIPQQLWEPVKKAYGVWTICLHPNDTPETVLESLEQLILTNRCCFVWSMDELVHSFASRRRGVWDLLQEKRFVCTRNLQRYVTYQKIMSLASRCKRLFLAHSA